MKKSRSQNVTIKDIAEVAGCSPNTVSLAIRDSKRISRPVRMNIHNIATELGYIPNSAARNLRNKNSNIIGLHVYDIYNTVRADFVNRIIPLIKTELDYRPILGLGHSDYDKETSVFDSKWVKSFRELAVEAMIIMCSVPDELPEWSIRTPIIYAGNQPNESLKCDYVGLDRKEAAKLAVEYLINKGHKDIIFTGHCNTFYEFCCEIMQEHSLEPLPTTDIPVNAPEHFVEEYIVNASKRPSAIVSGDSSLAASITHYLRNEKFRIPEDISIISYDYLARNEMLAVPLTTVEQPIEELVESVMEILKYRLENPTAPHIHKLLKHKLVVRKSTN